MNVPLCTADGTIVYSGKSDMPIWGTLEEVSISFDRWNAAMVRPYHTDKSPQRVCTATWDEDRGLFLMSAQINHFSPPSPDVWYGKFWIQEDPNVCIEREWLGTGIVEFYLGIDPTKTGEGRYRWL